MSNHKSAHKCSHKPSVSNVWLEVVYFCIYAKQMRFHIVTSLIKLDATELYHFPWNIVNRNWHFIACILQKCCRSFDIECILVMLRWILACGDSFRRVFEWNEPKWSHQCQIKPMWWKHKKFKAYVIYRHRKEYKPNLNE